MSSDHAKKASQWSFSAGLLGSDSLAGLTTSAGTPNNVLVSVTNLLANSQSDHAVANGFTFYIKGSISTPANSTSMNVSQGALMWDSNYLYVAVANNVVKRLALATF